MMRRIVIVAWCALIGSAVLSYCFFTGPHMKLQANWRPYRFARPAAPEGTSPAAPPRDTVPVAALATDWSVPPPTPQALARGRVYYGYYCLACHGAKGDGAGPVGESYDPQPADLRRPPLAALSDRELLGKMLTGVGHEPALESVIPMEHRPWLVTYVRSLAQATNAVPLSPRR